MSISVQDLDYLVEELAAWRKKADDIEETLKNFNKTIAQKEMHLMHILKELGKDSYKCEHGTVYSIERVSYTVPKTPEDREAFFGYLREAGVFEQLITVHSQTLNSYAKSFYEAAKERGDLFASIPGLAQPKITETLGLRKG